MRSFISRPNCARFYDAHATSVRSLTSTWKVTRTKMRPSNFSERSLPKLNFATGRTLELSFRLICAMRKRFARSPRLGPRARNALRRSPGQGRLLGLRKNQVAPERMGLSGLSPKTGERSEFRIAHADFARE